MPESFDPLEQELRQFAPAAPRSALDARIAESLAGSSTHGRSLTVAAQMNLSPRGDRLLIATLSAAAASLVVVITLLGSDYHTSRPASAEPSSTLAQTRYVLLQLTQDSGSGTLMNHDGTTTRRGN